MSAPRIVSPQEAQQVADAIAGSTFTLGGVAAADLAHTVATEPDRIRAAVGRAMQVVAQEMPNDGDCARAFVRAIRILKSEGLVADAIDKSADL